MSWEALEPYHRTFLGTVCLAAVTLLGCGDPDRLPTYPASGVVHFGSKPLVGGGHITLVPMNGDSEKPASGTIADVGTFTLGTYEEADGAIAGHYRVVIEQYVDREPEVQQLIESPEQEGSLGPESEMRVAESDRIPFIYSDYRKSPLTVTIEPKENTLTFELKDQP